MFRTGYILNWRGDLLWFLALPFWVTAIALACQQWASSVVLVSIALWITVPHHFATWLRTYGVREDWTRWKDRLIVGPLVIIGLAAAGLKWAPLTLLLVVTMWDHQHSIMQQHGFARIYDFKAKTGSPATGRWDLWLNWVLYGNLLLTAPMFTRIWMRELWHWNVPVSVHAVQAVQAASWAATGLFGCAYLVFLARTLRAGYPLNPLKYCFIAGSYFLWYFVSWQTTSILVYGVAHRLMHGLQYIVIVYWFLRRRGAQQNPWPGIAARLVRPGNVAVFLGACALYAVVYQLLRGSPLDEFGFGLFTMMGQYREAAPVPDVEPLTHETGYDLGAAVLISSLGLMHYYFDSFIWKVRDSETQAGL